MKVESVFLALVPFLILYSVNMRKKENSTSHSLNKAYLYLPLGACIAIFVYLLLPSYRSVIQVAREDLLTSDANALRIEGIKTDPVNYKTIKEVEASVKQIQPKTIFTFPIQPFYYRFATHHGSRYLTFEPQTTIAEQNTTIADLQKTKPEVVIFDPLQAQGLSGSLWKISHYITTNYEIHQEIVNNEILWVMKPKKFPAQDDKLVFQLYKDNKNKADAQGVQNKEMRLENAVWQHADKISLFIDTDNRKVLKISIPSIAGMSKCGTITIKYIVNETHQTRLCAERGEINIPIRANSKNVEIELLKQTGASIIWNNPSIVEE